MLIVVSVLTVVAILGVSFVFSMHLETQAARQFSATTQARYLAEAGISHARALLDEDRLGTRIDALTESWVDQFAGSDVDVDGNGSRESIWWSVDDSVTNTTVGRYGVLLTDEGEKANLNAGLADPDGAGVDELDLTTLLQQAGVSNAAAIASAIETYRYGLDGKPGDAQVDDDQDGTVDDPGEYQPFALRGDDRRFDAMEELLGLGGLSANDLKKLERVATVYSWDPNVTMKGQPRLNVNTATANELLSVLLATGGGDPWQMAVNIADDVDTDLAMSQVSRTSVRYHVATQGSLDPGAWTLQGGSPPPYATTQPNGQPLSWTITIPTSGTFYVLVHGVPGQKIGDVSLAGQTKPSMEEDDSFGAVDVSSLGGSMTVQVSHHEPAGTTCVFEGIELATTESNTGLPTVGVRGIEAVRFNELMIAPTLELTAATASSTPPATSGWVEDAQGFFSNSSTGSGTWTWTNAPLPSRPHSYYLRVFGAQTGQTVGEITINGRTETLKDGDRHTQPLPVGSNKTVTITIGKSNANGTYYFQKLSLSVEPDAEYVELINLSDAAIDVSGWIIEGGQTTGGFQARWPPGSIIPPHGLIVGAVDVDDTQTNMDNNNIDARSFWWDVSTGVPPSVKLVQLEFPSGGPTPDDDWLQTILAPLPQPLVLRHPNTWVVDQVEYPLPLPTSDPFQSLEKGDPSVVLDADGDGIDDGWYPSLGLYTPGAPNNNTGLQEFEGSQLVIHDPATEVNILNQPLDSLGELVGVPSGAAWTAVATVDLGKIVDQFTVQGLRLETEGHLVQGQPNWQEKPDGYEISQLGEPKSVGTWVWSEVPDGPYRVSLYGWSGEQFAVRWQLSDGSYSSWSPPLSADAQGRIVVGQITVPAPPSVVANALTLEVRCESPTGICHVNHLWLDPTLVLVGVVNLNTAPLEVLMSLPGMTAVLAQQLMAARPFGDQGGNARGIGDLLMGSVLGAAEEDKLDRFRRLAHLVTVRSWMFHILSVGESLEQNKPSAAQRIQAIVQR